MSVYRENPDAIRALVRPREVHRDVYIDDEVFELEMEHLFANTWVYLGHGSQVPEPGDFLTTKVGHQPLLVSRHRDGKIYVNYNRCPHKGTQIQAEECGNTGRVFTCPYHGWGFKTDGSLAGVPLKQGYDGTGFDEMAVGQGLQPVKNVQVYRDFIFVKLNEGGLDFDEFFGESLSTIDNMIDRSPEGKLEIVGAPLRYMHRCNWKMLQENQTDTCHPMIVHESSAGTAVKVWKETGRNDFHPAIELITPFTAPYKFYDDFGIRVWPNGHGHTGVSNSIHADYAEIPGYWDSMVESYGEERAREILNDVRHNTVYWPNIMVKGPLHIVRIFKPLAADKTLVESWTFRVVGAPDQFLERTMLYNRTINAPTSIVGHDDLEMYERIQRGLHANAYDWVNVARLYVENEPVDKTAVVRGTSERQMRNQFHAWAKFMTMSMVRDATESLKDRPLPTSSPSVGATLEAAS
ncbi:MAG: aromatic ring-hydroxylating dioxygenase subunit alpha [Rhodospirillaceae bacterium]|nr:aromatic ring-hydroxylating dioxygenase subunit alpha [Rhodospirillaceae bacterium]